MGRRVGDWEMEPAPIGSGSFAIVWKARHVQTGVLAAVKEIITDKLSPKLHESLESEIRVLRQTRHRNIVGLLDLIQEPGKLFLVLEFCSGGDLGQYLRRYRSISEPTARYFMRQLSEGLRELHALNVLHRDLKPQNLLLSDTSQQPLLKIADFGFARNLHPQGMAETLCGSPLYMAPEILQSHKYDARADLWSVGTILHELLTGRPPFTGANHIQLLQNIKRLEPWLPESLPPHLSPACRHLLTRLLRHQPHQRMGFDEFFTHPFLQQGASEGQRWQEVAGGEQVVLGQQGPGLQHQGLPVIDSSGGSTSTSRSSQDAAAAAMAQEQYYGGTVEQQHGHQAHRTQPHRQAFEQTPRPHHQHQPHRQAAPPPPQILSPKPRHVQQVTPAPTPEATPTTDSDYEYVVVSGSNSPEPTAHGGARGRLTAAAAAAAALSREAAAQQQQRHKHHHVHSQQQQQAQQQHHQHKKAYGAGGGMSSMAAAMAAAMATVTRSMHPQGVTQAAAKHGAKGTFFYCPSLTSSQLVDPATLETRSVGLDPGQLAGGSLAAGTARDAPAAAAGQLPTSSSRTSSARFSDTAAAAAAASASASEVAVRSGSGTGSSAASSQVTAAVMAASSGPGLPSPQRQRQQQQQQRSPQTPPFAGAAAAAAPPMSSSSSANSRGNDLSMLAHQIRLPEHLDPADLLQRVIQLLAESARARAAEAEAVELAAEESEEAGYDGGHFPNKQEEEALEERKRARRQRAQASAGASPALLLALHLYCCRLLEAGLAVAMGSTGATCGAKEVEAQRQPRQQLASGLDGRDGGAAGGSVGLGTAAATAADGQGGIEAAASEAAEPASEGRRPDQQQAAQPGPTREAACSPVAAAAPAFGANTRLLLPLKLQAKALLAGLEGRAMQELRTAAAAEAEAGSGATALEPVPEPAAVVLDSALRYSRAAAADELLGLLPSGVEGYARASDLLLFLLTDLQGLQQQQQGSTRETCTSGDSWGSNTAGARAAGAEGGGGLPEGLKPRLGPEERQRVYTVYSAVKLRQAACMTALNAQLRG